MGGPERFFEILSNIWRWGAQKVGNTPTIENHIKLNHNTWQKRKESNWWQYINPIKHQNKKQEEILLFLVIIDIVKSPL